jgi:hypothetical protein
MSNEIYSSDPKKRCESRELILVIVLSALLLLTIL